MAVPTITSLDVTQGPTQGRTLVVITGTNFRTYPPYGGTGKVPAPRPTVEVLFGGEPAYEVKIENATTVWCLSPVHDPGAVDVTVTNLDNEGNPIAGETATKAGGFTYLRPYLRAPVGGGTTFNGDLYRLVAAVIVEWRRQVLENTVIKKPHSDYSAAPSSARTRLASLPGVVLWGPKLRRSRFMTDQAYQNHSTGETTFKARRPPEARDVLFDFTLISDNVPELLNLLEAVDHFFDKNQTLRLARDPSSPSGPFVEFEVFYDAPAGVDDEVDTDNKVSATGSFYVQGFEMQSRAGFSDDGIEHRGSTVEVIDFGTDQMEGA